MQCRARAMPSQMERHGEGTSLSRKIVLLGFSRRKRGESREDKKEEGRALAGSTSRRNVSPLSPAFPGVVRAVESLWRVSLPSALDDEGPFASSFPVLLNRPL